MPKVKNQPLYFILQNIRSLYNVGSLFRSADGLGVDKIFLCGYTGTPPRKEISKTALGAETTVPWEHHHQTARLIKQLKKDGVQIVALELTKGAVDLKTFKPKFPLAIILGNEVLGITPAILKLADAVVQIPMRGGKESLNVSVAGGIAGYILAAQRMKHDV
ncbi:RNA methyltransferase [Candidatus Falkowbacteria bacterium]|nr:RNA methyltransferase [Candidatus Falkowbacteria bacterium]